MSSYFFYNNSFRFIKTVFSILFFFIFLVFLNSCRSKNISSASGAKFNSSNSKIFNNATIFIEHFKASSLNKSFAMELTGILKEEFFLNGNIRLVSNRRAADLILKGAILRIKGPNSSLALHQNLSSSGVYAMVAFKLKNQKKKTVLINDVRIEEISTIVHRNTAQTSQYREIFLSISRKIIVKVEKSYRLSLSN